MNLTPQLSSGQWQAAKRKPTQFGDNKTQPDKAYKLVAETLASFVDKCAIAALSKTPQGREILEAQGVPETPAE